MYTTPPMDASITPLPEMPPDGPAYTVEVLAPEAWTDLQGELAVGEGRLHPEHSVVVVVRNPAGEPVARWVALNTVHLEGLLVLPPYRKNPAVAGKLFLGMIEALRDLGIPEVLTLVQDPAVAHLAAEAGFQPVPGQVFKLVL